MSVLHLSNFSFNKQILSMQEEEEHGRFIFLFIDASTLETINSLKENCGKDYSYLSTYIYSINSVNSFSNDYLECIVSRILIITYLLCSQISFSTKVLFIRKSRITRIIICFMLIRRNCSTEVVPNNQFKSPNWWIQVGHKIIPL